MKKSGLIIVIAALFTSCVKKQIPNSSSLLGLDYYPLTKGKYVIYDADSTVYTDLPLSSVNTKYRIKEKIADSFTDNEGKPAIRLERYIKKYDPKKSYDSIPWVIKEVWMINADNKSIQVSERDVRYTKLIFPVQQNATWNGNARNTVGDWKYSYSYIDQSENINNHQLDKVLLVNEYELRTLISYQSYKEKYAKGIGLVYREIYDIYSNNVVQGVPVENRIENGVIYKLNYVSNGYE